MEPAIVLVSGGLDSAVSLFWARKKGYSIIPLTFNFHNRPRPEIRATRALLQRVGVGKPLELDLPFLRTASDLKKSQNSRMLERAGPTYIPARNAIYYSIASHFAEVFNAPFVVGGHNGQDPGTFPDSRPEYFEELTRFIQKGLLSRPEFGVEILLPLARKSKAEVVRLGVELGVPFDLTWSCLHEGRKPCEACSSCKERAAGFAGAAFKDPGFSLPSRS